MNGNRRREGNDDRAKERASEMLRQIKAGLFLADIRAERGMTLQDVGDKIGVSATYISDIEKGRKVPSDTVIRDLAQLYEINENDLFERYGKIPLAALEMLEKYDELREVIAEIETNPKITREMAEKLVNDFIRVYEARLKRGK